MAVQQSAIGNEMAADSPELSNVYIALVKYLLAQWVSVLVHLIRMQWSWDVGRGSGAVQLSGMGQWPGRWTVPSSAVCTLPWSNTY
jgi:hypothetical protein